MKHNYVLESENITLRQLENCDIEFLRNWRNNKENTKYLRSIGYITPQQQEMWFKKYLKNDDEIAFAIVETKELNRIVGSCSLYNFIDDQAEFGKILIGDSEAHGRGIGLKATEIVVKFAFHELNLSRVVLECYENNIPAQKIYKKVGFTTTGKTRNDGFDKAIFMSICKSTLRI